MKDLKALEQLVLREEMSIADFALEVIDEKIERARGKNSLSLPALRLRRQMWTEAIIAKEKGKPLIFIGGALPMEIFRAMDCAVFHLDSVPLLFAEFTALCAKYIEESAILSEGMFCSLDRINLGAAMLKNYGLEPDLFVFNPVTCDSSRSAYHLVDMKLDLPTFWFDTPGFRSKRTTAYLATQLKNCIAFLEERIGRRLDFEKLRECMEASDLNFKLLKDCAEMRKIVPCPLPSYLMSFGSETDYYACRGELTELLQAELAAAKKRAERGEGVCDEKHRVVMIQNMMWGLADIGEWMEERFGATPLLDTFGFRGEFRFDNPRDLDACMTVMADKMMNTPVIHGASGSTLDYAQVIDVLFAEYSPDASIFLGNVGCRHIWASTKILTDMVESKYNKATLFVEMDFADGRYKTLDTVKEQIAEFFETVVR